MLNFFTKRREKQIDEYVAIQINCLNLKNDAFYKIYKHFKSEKEKLIEVCQECRQEFKVDSEGRIWNLGDTEKSMHFAYKIQSLSSKK